MCSWQRLHNQSCKTMLLQELGPIDHVFQSGLSVNTNPAENENISRSKTLNKGKTLIFNTIWV